MSGKKNAGEEVREDAGEEVKLTVRERAAAEHEALFAPARNFHNVVPGVEPVGTNDGYSTKTLKNGVKQYYADHDGWNTSDEALIQAHVADYRARKGGRVSG